MRIKKQKERLTERIYLRITPSKKKQWQENAELKKMSLRAWLQMKVDSK